MSQHRYVGVIDGEKMRGFHSREELDHWLKDKPEATFIKYSVKRQTKPKMNLDEYELAPF